MHKKHNTHHQQSNMVKTSLHFMLIMKMESQQRLQKIYKKVNKSLIAKEKAIVRFREAEHRLEDLSLEYMEKMDNAKKENIELNSAYYYKALVFLQDFESEATEQLFTNTRKQIKTFIYSSLYESMAACENSKSFKALFKVSEGLEFDLWVTERLTQTYLRIKEYLDRAHGIPINAEHLPATEIELFESIRTQIAARFMNVDEEDICIPINEDEEDMILNWSINGCNYRIKKAFFKHAFKLSIFINKQLEDISHGMGLARLGNLFARESALTEITYKNATTKDKMEDAVAYLKLNVGDKKKDIRYWSQMTQSVHEAIAHFDKISCPQLDKLESEWLEKIMENEDGTLPFPIVNSYCAILNLHKKLILNSAKEFELEGSYSAFTNPNLDYETMSVGQIEEEIEFLNEDNEELKSDIELMGTSPDALFKLIQTRSRGKHNVTITNDPEDELEMEEEFGEDYDENETDFSQGDVDNLTDKTIYELIQSFLDRVKDEQEGDDEEDQNDEDDGFDEEDRRN